MMDMNKDVAGFLWIIESLVDECQGDVSLVIGAMGEEATLAKRLLTLTCERLEETSARLRNAIEAEYAKPEAIIETEQHAAA